MRIVTRGFIVMTFGLLGVMGCAGERPSNLGSKGGLLAACPSSPNCVSSQDAGEGQRIAPLAFKSDPDSAFTRFKLLLGRRSDTKITEELPDYLRVELRTNLFVDDGEFLLDRTRGVIHVRSASRLGYSDLGKNRSRLEEIRRQFNTAKGKP